MEVTLLTMTPDPLRVMFTAARTCYSTDTPEQIFNSDAVSDRDYMLRIVRNCIVRDHNSVLRHAHFYFSLAGCSRVVSHQLVRHSAGIDFDQQSQRYVQLTGDAVMPEGETFPAHAAVVQNVYNVAFAAYENLLEHGVAKEVARYVLPGGATTNLFCSANLAALLHLYRVRVQGTTGRPQDETAELALRMCWAVVRACDWLEEFFPGIAEKAGELNVHAQ